MKTTLIILDQIKSIFSKLLNEIENTFELFIYAFLMDDDYIANELKPIIIEN